VAGEGDLKAPRSRALGRQRQRVTELGEEDVEHEDGDKHADRRVQDLLQFLNLFRLLLRRLLQAHPISLDQRFPSQLFRTY